MESETWAWVPGTEMRYQVSDTGRVRSHTSIGKGRDMGRAEFKGRLFVRLRYADGIAHRKRVEALVAEAFLKGDGKLVHLDGDALNCRADNLAYE